MACAGGGAAGCGGIAPRLVGSYLEDLRDQCQSPDSNGDIRVGGRVHMANYGDDEADEIKLFSKPG